MGLELYPHNITMAILSRKTQLYCIWSILCISIVFLIYRHKSTIIDAFTQCADVPDSSGCDVCQTTTTTNGTTCNWDTEKPENEKCTSFGSPVVCGPKPAPGPAENKDIKYSYQNTISTLAKTSKSYETMTKKQLAEQLSVYGTTYTKDSKFIEGLYDEIHSKKSTSPAKFDIDPINGMPGVDNPSPLPVFYEPGTFIYNGTGYEPPYSRLMLTTTTYMQPAEIQNAPYKMGGFCEEYKYSSIETDKKCNELPQDACASTDCCVLLGGQKCVAGNEYGPTNKAAYSNFLLKNKDYYYYQGKCYGNCET
jgi:hypothetical protein